MHDTMPFRHAVGLTASNCSPREICYLEHELPATARAVPNLDKSFLICDAALQLAKTERVLESVIRLDTSETTIPVCVYF
jgi:hypothetical protein